MTFVDLDTIHTPSAGQRPPAAWGAQVNENFDYLNTEVLAKLGIWTSYTPSLVQSGTVTKTVTYGRYIKLGRLVIFQVLLAVTGSGSSATKVTVALPATAAQAGNMEVGVGSIYDASATTAYGGRVVLDTTGTAAMSPVAGGSYLGVATFTQALASGDSVSMLGVYESAT